MSIQESQINGPQKEKVGDKSEPEAHSARSVFWVYDPSQKKMESIHPTGEHFHGLPLEHPSSDEANVLSAMAPSERQRFANLIERQLAGEATDEPFHFRKADGAMGMLWLRTFPILDEHGALYRIVGITEGARAYQRAENDGEASHKHFHLIHHVAKLVCWEWDLETGKTTHKGAVENVFGKDSSSFDDWSRGVHPVDLAEVESALWRALDHSGEYQSEFRYIWPDGSVHWLIGRGGVIYDQQGKPVQMMGINFEISAPKRYDQDLVKSEAEESNRAKREFLANMNHEIRTPLTAIIGYADLLLSPETSEDERQIGLDAIRRNGRQLTKIVDEILDLSKAEAGQLEIERVPCDLPQLLREVMAIFDHKAKDKGLELIVRSHGLIPCVIESDPTRLKQILVNIVGNAIKFTSSGSVEIEVKLLELEETHGHLLAFIVTDTGRGLMPGEQSTLFQPFSQADSSTTRKYSGAGLGLVLSRRLARLLGGDVVLTDSKPQKGSCFTITVATGALEKDRFIELPLLLEEQGASERPLVSPQSAEQKLQH